MEISMNYVDFEGEQICPSKVVCVGRNYVEHIQELNNEMPDEPVIFLKPNSAITNELLVESEQPIHYEGELTFLIYSGRIKGVGFGLDLTKREVQSSLKAKGLPWERSKAFDNSAVFSRFIEVHENIETISMELHINGNLTQHATFDLMLNKPNQLLVEVCSFLTLEDGDLLMTGTPKGVGRVHEGDVFVGKVLQDGEVVIEHRWTARNIDE
jgi:2-keto-4-pentenoate hydratase/2-oxohepta-3-ene-1,7-dioic acid hydratase in catechol pathway